MSFKEPSTMRIDRAKRKAAKEKLHKLGLKLDHFVDRIFDWIIEEDEKKIYDFMKNKKIIVLLMILVASFFAVKLALEATRYLAGF